MNKLFFSLGLTLFITSAAKAESQTLECHSSTGNSATLSAYVRDGALTHLIVRPAAGSAHALVINRLHNQNIEGTTIYTVVGVPGFMEVDNSILQGQSGQIKLASDQFTCN